MNKLALGLLFLAACRETVRDDAYSGTIEFPDVAVGSLVGGRVVEVRKQEGQRAKAGDVLVVLDPDEWQSTLDEARALAEATARELELLEAGARQEDIDRAKADAKRLELIWQVVQKGARKEEIAQAREDWTAADALFQEADAALTREQGLVREGSSTTELAEKALARAEAARARRSAAKQRLALLERGARKEEIEAARQAWLAQLQVVKRLEAGTRPEEIAAKRATLAAAHARIEVAQKKLEELTIRAPADCLVQTLDLRPGDLLAAGAPVAVLILPDEPWITIHVPESDLASVSVGKLADVTPDGHPPLEATVSWVSREAEFTPRNVQTRRERATQVFRVKLVLRGDTSLLKDGLWADVALR